MRRQRSTLFLVTTLLAAILVASGGWLLASEGGLRTVAAWLASERLTIEAPQGRLLGPLRIARLAWRGEGETVELNDLSLDWSPARLFAGELAILELSVGRATVQPAPNQPATPPPSALRLPLAVDIGQLRISELRYGDLPPVADLAASLASDGRHHTLRALSARSGELNLTATASLDGDDLALDARGELAGRLAGRPLEATLSASGRLAVFDLHTEVTGSLAGNAQATLTPFAEQPFSRLQLALRDLDPAAWQADWPAARLSLEADIAPQAQGIAGRFRIANALPGPLDRGRLPLVRLSGELRQRPVGFELAELAAALPGGAGLAGRGTWREDALELELAATRLDAAQIDSRLRSTRLAGEISATLAAVRRHLRLDLHDPVFRLRAEAEHDDQRLRVPRLELTASDARLAAHGEVALDGDGAFELAGELRHFDPGRFVSRPLPTTAIDAEFTASGRWRPALAGQLDFRIGDSRLAGQPLSGDGRLRFVDGRLAEGALQLAASANRLSARGALGRPGEQLVLNIEAPQLAPFGLSGGLAGQLTLTGELAQPRIAGRISAERLGLPGGWRLAGLTLAGEIGGDAAAPQRIELTLGQLESAALPGLAHEMRLTLAGSRQAHRIDASGELLDGNRLTLAATGGLADASWQGQLLELRLQSREAARNFRLAAPTPLAAGAAGWRLGPLTLAGESLDWRATFAGRADAAALTLSGEASGTRVGKIRGEFAAAMDGPYALAEQRPWRGRLESELADLAWLGDFLGDGWQSGGHLIAHGELAGTPAAPELSGSAHGDGLSLRQNEQGLQLVNGRLDLALAGRRLRVERLSFDSLLQAPPRALRQATARTPQELAAIVASPGHLEITGEIAVDRNGADNAALDLRLERVGAWQLPDQWLTLSGDARVSWRDGILGVRGRLAADAGYWQLAPAGAPRLSEDVVIRRPGDEAPSGGLRPRLDLDLAVGLGDRFWFEGFGLSSRLVGDVRFTAHGRDLPRASGSIRSRGGRFEAYGQKLEIERGVLSFNGLPDNPALDVRAVRKGLAVEPGVQIGGSVQKPSIRLVSDPELPDPEKLAWLVLGHGPEQMGAGDAPLLIAAAGGLLGNDAGNLVGQLRKTFGFDELGVRQGQIGDSGGRAPASRVAGGASDTAASTGNQIFSVGKRLSSNAVLSYEQALGKAESVVKLTVTLNRNLSLVGRAGSDNALDVFYTVVFGRGPRRH